MHVVDEEVSLIWLLGGLWQGVEAQSTQYLDATGADIP